MVQKRRRLSSDGKLFNMAYSHPPPYSRIKVLHCIWHTEYDDKPETMNNVDG